mgnify:CR=1 FL=1
MIAIVGAGAAGLAAAIFAARRGASEPVVVFEGAARPGAKILIREDARKIRLTEKETAIIKFLYRAGEKTVSRDVLLHDV